MISCFIGTYVSDGGEGIYKTTIDPSDGSLSSPQLLCHAKDSKYLICDNQYIYTIMQGEKLAGVAIYDFNGQLIDNVEYENGSSCYIIKNGEHIYTTNYTDGTISKLHFSKGKLTFIKQLLIQEKAGCHQAIIFNDNILLPCLLMDKVFVVDSNLNIIDTINFPEGSGPRHGIFSKDKSHLYIVGELNDTLYTFSVKEDSLEPVNEIYLLTSKDTPAKASAALRMSKNGKFLMISIRNANKVIMVDISKQDTPSLIQHHSSLGDHPRDILNIAEDRYLLVANRNTGNLVSLEIKNQNIIKSCSEISVKGAVSIGIMEE